VVLLLHAGQHVERSVDAVRWSHSHRQARDAARGATDDHVLLRQRHRRPPIEREGDGRHGDGHVVARVEATERACHRRSHPAPERVTHGGVHGRGQPREHRPGVDDGAAAAGRVECEGRRRYRHGPAADADPDHVDVVEGRAVRVGQQRRRLDPPRLPGGAEPERTGEVGGLVTRQAVGEDGAVHVLGLRRERERFAAESDEPLRRHGAARDDAEAPERVGRDGVHIVVERQRVLPEQGLERGRRVRQVERARQAPAPWARRGGSLRALRRPAAHGAVRGRPRRVERRRPGAARAGGARHPRGVVAGVDGHEERLRRRAEARADHVAGDAEELPARSDRHERPAWPFLGGVHGTGRRRGPGSRCERGCARRVGRRLGGEGCRPCGDRCPGNGTERHGLRRTRQEQRRAAQGSGRGQEAGQEHKED
jgi:hypothetical protein